MRKQSLWKHPSYGHVYGFSGPTPLGRFSFPSLMKPKDPPPPKPGEQPGQARYEVSILLEKASVEVQKFLAKLASMSAAMVELFNEGRGTTINLPEVLLKDGDKFDLEQYPYYAGMWVLVARNVLGSNDPKGFQVVSMERDADGNYLPTKLDSIEGGIIGKLVVTPLLTAHGVSFKLNTVQYVKDDDVRFGGGVRNYAGLLDEADEQADGEVPFDGGSKVVAPIAAPVQQVIPVPAPVAAPKVAAKAAPAAIPSVSQSVAAPVQQAPLAPKELAAKLRADIAAGQKAQIAGATKPGATKPAAAPVKAGVGKLALDVLG